MKVQYIPFWNKKWVMQKQVFQLKVAYSKVPEFIKKSKTKLPIIQWSDKKSIQDSNVKNSLHVWYLYNIKIRQALKITADIFQYFSPWNLESLTKKKPRFLLHVFYSQMPIKVFYGSCKETNYFFFLNIAY